MDLASAALTAGMTFSALHGLAAELRIGPVLAAVKQGAEVADLIVQLQDAIDDAIHAAADHDVVEDVIEGDVLVRHVRMRLEGDHASRLLQLRGELAHVEPVRAIGIVAAIGPRHLVVLGDEDRARHPPVRALGPVPALGAALGVIGPLALEAIGVKKVRRDRPPAAPPERDQPLGVGIRRRTGNGRMRFLIGLDDVADADLGP